MKLKADENIPTRAVELLRERGHDVSTVPEESLVGVPDARLALLAASDDRMLVTLDRGLADVGRYSPGTHPGIAVIHARELRPSVFHTLVVTFLESHSSRRFNRHGTESRPAPASPLGASGFVVTRAPEAERTLQISCGDPENWVVLRHSPMITGVFAMNHLRPLGVFSDLSRTKSGPDLLAA
ncbi:MAG: DUF5615 family PIN-like protein [Acidimicrobiia bacterium]